MEFPPTAGCSRKPALVTRRGFGLVATVLALLPLAAPAAEPPPLESSVITIQASGKSFTYFRPWERETRSLTKTGVVIGPREILTTAEGLQHLTLLRLQKGGRGAWHEGRVVWVNFHANIAVVTTAGEGFWPGLRPAQLANPRKDGNHWQLVRWKSGNLERRAAEFNQFLVQDGRLTFVQHLQLEASSEMAGVGWGEPLVAEGRVIALATGQIQNNCRFIPVSFFQPFLDARARGRAAVMGYFPFVWTQVENPETFKYLKLPGEPRGALVTDVPAIPAVRGKLQPRDIILAVDGHAIDNEGYYQDPDYGLLIMENLATRGRLAGDTLKLTLWRDGQELALDYVLPPARFDDKLLPEETFDHEPEYLIVGGLIFQPLDIPLLRSFGEDWRRRAPFRLGYYADKPPELDRRSLVVLTLVLPDPFNLGYQDHRFVVMDTFNGRKIATLKDLREAAKSPVNGFHEIQFMAGSTPHSIVLDANQEPAATARILRQYRIPAAGHLAN